MKNNSKFLAKTGVFCFIVNLMNYLSYYDMNYTESWLNGMLGCLGFYYTPLPLDTKDIIHGRNGSFHTLYQLLQQQLNKPLERKEFKVNEELLSILCRLLDLYDIALIWINNYHLKYSPYYQSAELWSLAVLLEISENNVIFFDNAIRSIEHKIFLRAVNCNGKGTIHFTKQNYLFWKEKESSVAAIGIRTTIDCLSSNCSVNNEYHGIIGMKRFAEDLEVYNDSATLYNLYYQLNRPGGLTLTREDMSKYCVELKEKWHIIETESSRTVYNNLAECWRKVSNLLFKLSNTGNQELRKRIINRIDEVIEIENEGVKCLTKLAKQLEDL